MTDPGEITQLLVAARQGEPKAMDRLFPLVYNELHGMARRRLSGRRPGQTLDTTALVHEAYLKMVDQTQARWNDRSHFLAVSAIAMRHILVDYARRKAAQKRGGEEQHVVLEEGELGVAARVEEILAIDQALTSLAERSERLSKLVELRFFAGLSVEETAGVLEVSERTVKRDWRKAKAYLYRELSSSA